MKKLFMIMVTLMCVSWAAVAQNRTIHGQVVDAGTNEPLIGATVMPVGGGQGAATDVDGNFTLSVPGNVKSAKVSYVGYKELTVALHDGMKIRMESSSTDLQDVVVVAYGTANKESLTGSVAVVGAGDIEDRPISSVTAALEGNAPGVQVNNSVSYPGSSPEIRIRGFNSVNGSNAPLYVVDGVVYDGDVADINPADVESMSVLKDAASCALYGNRGANGVILVTTKRAKNVGKVDVTLSINQGFYERAIPFYDRLGANDWMEQSLIAYTRGKLPAFDSWEQALASCGKTFVNDMLRGENIYGVANDAVFTPEGKVVGNPLPGYTDLDWWNAIGQTGYRQEYNVNATAATDKFNVFSSFGYLKENGYVKESDFERFNGRLVANYNPVSYFKTGFNLAASYSNSEVAGVDEDNYSDGELGYTTNPFLAMMYAPVQPYYAHYMLADQEADPNHIAGDIIRDENGKPVWGTSGLNKGDNVAWGMGLNSNNYTNLSVTGNIYATGVLPYGFEVSLRASMYRRKQNSKKYSNNIIGSQQGMGGLDIESYGEKTYTFMQQLSWNHDYGLNNIDVFLDHENYEASYDDRFVRMSGQLMEDMPFMGNFETPDVASDGVGKLRTESYLGRVKYNYDQKYFAEASVRRDGTSRFTKDNRWGTFWSAGASWVISKEKFLQNVNWINYLKLRAAYGSVGNDASAGYYAYWSVYTQATYDKVGIAFPYRIPGDNLKWESTKTFDIALEGSLFDDRFTFSVGYYNKQNADLLYYVTKPMSAGATWSGSALRVLQNIGTMENWGWEVQLGVDIIRNKNLVWDFNIDASFLKNKIVKLPNGQDIPGQALFQGKSLYEKYMYTWAGIDKATGHSLYYMAPNSPDYYSYNEKGEKVYNKDTYNQRLEAAKKSGAYYEIGGKGYTDRPEYAGRELQGTALPTVYGSFGTTLRWKGINFGAMFTYSLGGKTYNSLYQSLMSQSSSGASALHKDILKAWTAPYGNKDAEGNWEHAIDPNGVPVQDYELNSYTNMGSSRFLQNSSYLTLKNLSISYDFPKKWMQALKLQNINLGFSVDNLFIVTAMKGMNPQYSFSGGQDNYYVPARVYNFSLSFKL